LIVSAANASDNISPQSIISALPSFDKQFNITYKTYPAPKFTIQNTTELQMIGRQFDDDVFKNRLVDSYSPYRFGSYFIFEANNRTKQYRVATFVNLTSQDVAAAYPQFIYEAILKRALGRPNFKLRVTTTPYPITEKLR
jgi:hypothetical protein